MKTFLSLMLFPFFLVISCASMQQYHAMSSKEKGEYIALAPKMTIDQRKEFLAQENSNARMEYLKGLGLYGDFVEQAAFSRMEKERKEDFLKAYQFSTASERKQFLNNFNEKTRDQIESKDLQFGWDNKQVILALGFPQDILEKRKGESINQLWIYKKPQIATFLFFQDGRLKDWAK